MKEPIEEHKYKEKLELKHQLPSLDNLVKICCPSCSATVPSVNININKEIAKCDDCDGVFSFSNNHELIQHSNTPQMLQPEGVEIFHFQNELDISFKTSVSYSSVIILSIFAPIIFMLLINSISDPKLLIPTGFLSLLLMPFLLRLIASMKNKIYVGIDDELLSIIRRPFRFSFGKDKYYNVDEFDQLYVQEKKHPNGSGKLYIINAILNGPNGQKHIELTPPIDSKSKAKYIEQEIEQHLNITNRPVPEED